MSSSDHGRWHRGTARRALISALAAAVTLSACTIQPLYGPSLSGGSVGASLAKVSVDPVNDRVGQQVRNRLVFDLTGGSGTTEPIYQMHLSVSSSELPLGITQVGIAPTVQVTVAVTYELKKIGSPDIIVRNTSRATATYDRVTQGFANVRAKLDAEDRAAAVVADQIRTRVAIALATHA